MDSIFSDMHFVAIYVDDIVIYSASREEHVEQVTDVINRLPALHIPVRVKKSRFGQRKI